MPKKLSGYGSKEWEFAAQVDPTLVRWRKCHKNILRRKISPITFTRRRLFTEMIAQNPVVFSNLRVPIGDGRSDAASLLLDKIERDLPRATRIRARVGISQTYRYLPPSELVAKWHGARANLCVTDFHFRGTRLEPAIDHQALSNFNLLADASGRVADEEMMTLVLSSQGAFTDSHSDNPDGSNHCVSGSKLWLVWDTVEGANAGLQNVERDPVYDRAAFDLETFCRLKSARWFTVEHGQTLFLPGRFTHKVITLERYIGFGSFFVSLPNFLQTITRWTQLPPTWQESRGEPPLINKITKLAVARLRRLMIASNESRLVWGSAHLRHGAKCWANTNTLADQARVRACPGIDEFISLVKQIGARTSR